MQKLIFIISEEKMLDLGVKLSCYDDLGVYCFQSMSAFYEFFLSNKPVVELVVVDVGTISLGAFTMKRIFQKHKIDVVFLKNKGFLRIKEFLLKRVLEHRLS